MKHFPAALSSAALLAVLSSSASASIVPMGQVVHTVEVAGDAAMVELPKFNSAYGELRAVRFRVETVLSCDVGLENTSRQASMAGFRVGEQTSLSMAMRSRPLVSVTPQLELTQLLAGFDGQMDYDGLSGFQMRTLSLSEASSASPQLNASELSSFVTSQSGEKAVLDLARRSLDALQAGPGVHARLGVERRVRVTVAYMFAPWS